MTKLNSQYVPASRNRGVRKQTAPLTANKFLELCVDEVDRADRYNRPLAIALFRVDGYATLGARKGEAVAEEVFAEIAANLLGDCRGQDRLARLGSDQLGLLCPKRRSRTPAALPNVCGRPPASRSKNSKTDVRSGRSAPGLPAICPTARLRDRTRTRGGRDGSLDLAFGGVPADLEVSGDARLR